MTFVTDAELIERMNLPEKIGRRALAALDAGVQNTRKFPGKDPRFGGRRYLPAVVQWFHDYYGVRASAGEPTVTLQPMWEEHLGDLETGKARRREHAGARVA
jgi:hypothetical protein